MEMKEVIMCPKCGKSTIKEREVYRIEIKEVTLKDRIKNQKEYYAHLGEPICGDINFMPFGSWQKPMQIIYECSGCGYTEVVDF